MLVVVVLLRPAVEDEDDVDGFVVLLEDGGEAVDVCCDAGDNEGGVGEGWGGHDGRSGVGNGIFEECARE